MLLKQIITPVRFRVLSGNELANDVTSGYICDIHSDGLSTSWKTTLWISRQTDDKIAGQLYASGLRGTVTL